MDTHTHTHTFINITHIFSSTDLTKVTFLLFQYTVLKLNISLVDSA